MSEISIHVKDPSQALEKIAGQEAQVQVSEGVLQGVAIEYIEGVIVQSREAKGAFLETMQKIVPKIVEMYNDGCWNLPGRLIPKITRVIAFQSLARNLSHRKNIFSITIHREHDVLQRNLPLELDVIIGPLQDRTIIDHESDTESDQSVKMPIDVLSWVEPYIIIHPQTGYLLARMDHTGPESVQKIRKFSDIYESAEATGDSVMSDLRETIEDIEAFDQFIVVFRSS